MAVISLSLTIKPAMTPTPIDNTCRLCAGVGEVEIATLMRDCPGCGGDGIIE